MTEYTYDSWCIYYADGSTFSNEQGPPDLAPCTGVLAVCHFTMDNRRAIDASKDFYIYDEQSIYKDVAGGMWYGADIAGLYQYLFRPGKKIVKFGALVSDPVWRKVLDRILKEWPESLDYRVKRPQPL